MLPNDLEEKLNSICNDLIPSYWFEPHRDLKKLRKLQMLLSMNAFYCKEIAPVFLSHCNFNETTWNVEFQLNLTFSIQIQNYNVAAHHRLLMMLHEFAIIEEAYQAITFIYSLPFPCLICSAHDEKKIIIHTRNYCYSTNYSYLGPADSAYLLSKRELYLLWAATATTTPQSYIEWLMEEVLLDIMEMALRR